MAGVLYNPVTLSMWQDKNAGNGLKLMTMDGRASQVSSYIILRYFRRIKANDDDDGLFAETIPK